MLVDKLYKEIVEEKEAAETERQKSFDAAVEQARNEIPSLLGSLADEIIVGNLQGFRTDQFIFYCWFRDWNPDIYSFYIVYRTNVHVSFTVLPRRSGHNHLYYVYGDITEDNRNNRRTVEFFAGLRDAYQERRGVKIKYAKHVLSPDPLYRAADIETAIAARTLLISEGEQKIAEDIYGRWLEWYEGEQERLRRVNEEVSEYKKRISAYTAEVARIREQNEEVYKEIQQDLDGKFQLWELTYGVIAFEDGFPFVEEGVVVVASPDPDDDGYWDVVEYDGRVSRKRYFHPVSIGDSLFNVSDGQYVPNWEQKIYYRPQDEERLQQLIKDRVQLIPERPTPGRFLFENLSNSDYQELVKRDEMYF